MVFCTYCGHSFTRDEHLERHILTHTNVKPFKCFTCYMSFSRRDLLQRHYAVHGRDQNNQEGLPLNHGMMTKSAGRTPIACSNCAKTKTKCDKKFPCSRCASRNLTCTLRPTRRQSKQAVRAQSLQSSSADSLSVNSIQLQQTTPMSSSRSSPQPQQQRNDESRHMISDMSSMQQAQRLNLRRTDPIIITNNSVPIDMHSLGQEVTSVSRKMISPLLTPESMRADACPSLSPSSAVLESSNHLSRNIDMGDPAYFIDWSQFQFQHMPSEPSQTLQPGGLYACTQSMKSTYDMPLNAMLDVNSPYYSSPTYTHTPTTLDPKLNL